MKPTFFMRSKFALLFLFRKSTDAKQQSFSRIMKILKIYSVNHQLLQQVIPPIRSIMWMWKMIRRVGVLIAPVKNLMNPIHFLMPKKNKRMKIILSRKSQKIWISTISQERIHLIKIFNFWYIVINFFRLFFMPLINLQDYKKRNLRQFSEPYLDSLSNPWSPLWSNCRLFCFSFCPLFKFSNYYPVSSIIL